MVEKLRDPVKTEILLGGLTLALQPIPCSAKRASALVMVISGWIVQPKWRWREELESIVGAARAGEFKNASAWKERQLLQTPGIGYQCAAR